MLGPVIKLIKNFSSSKLQSLGINENSPLSFTFFSTIGCLPFIIINSFFSEISGLTQFSSLDTKPKLKKKSNSPIAFTDNLISELKFKKIFLISNKNENRTIELSEKLVKFKSQLIEDQKKRLEEKSINTEIIDLSEIQNINETSYGLYPTVGENLDYLNSNNLKIDYLYRKLDQYSWQYCNKGFFNFKNYIPKIVSTFS